MSQSATILETARALASAPVSIDGDGSSQRPYHHGDLSRALVLAGRRILESQGVAALSLRAVAREAGVSPAAPYHHFKDKGELLDAVAEEGWKELGGSIVEARRGAATAKQAMTEIGVAYVCFARANPALYRIMYDAACDRASMPGHGKPEQEGNGWTQVAEAIVQAGVCPPEPREIELATIAAWCTAHGVAEMAGFREFDDLKTDMGGEEAFVRAVLGHVGIFGGGRS